MNYEQRYKEALKAVKELQEANPSDDGIQNWVNEKFPELKVSEDEKIREILIEFFEDWRKTKSHLWGINVNDILAWLEKLKVFAEYGDGLYYFGNNGFTYVGNPTCDMSWLEKQGKVPPADKSGPQFNEGDWIVFNNRHDSVYQVEKIENYEYTLRHFLGGSMPLSFSHEDMIRAWNVKDARNGDVLAFYSEYKGNKMVQVGIIKKYVGKHGGCSNTFNIYVGVNWENNLQIGEYMGCSDIRPATKEQRELLLQKMHEDGYTFDFEKKELKKLKFRVGDVIEPAKPNGSYIPVRVRYIGDGSYYCESDDRKAFSSIPICNENEYVLTKQKPAKWSEEDENMVRYIGNAITCRESAKYLEEKGVDMIKAHRWLESFRPQPHWKPSQEQMYMLEWLTTNVLDGGVVGNKAKEVLNTLIKQLKSL